MLSAVGLGAYFGIVTLVVVGLLEPNMDHNHAKLDSVVLNELGTKVCAETDSNGTV